MNLDERTSNWRQLKRLRGLRGLRVGKILALAMLALGCSREQVERIEWPVMGT